LSPTFDIILRGGFLWSSVTCLIQLGFVILLARSATFVQHRHFSVSFMLCWTVQC